MEDLYKDLYKAEKNHWWFNSRRRIVSNLFWNGAYSLNKKPKIASVGSSTGVEVEYL